MTKFFSSPKVRAGIQQRWEEANEGVKNGEPISGGAVEYVVDFLLRKNEVLIRARFKRLGLEIPEDTEISVEAIVDLVRVKTGLDVQELTPDGIMRAVDGQLAAQLSEKLGLTVDTVFDVDAAKEQVKAQLLEKLANGDGAGILNGPALTRLRAVATFQRAGFTPKEMSNAYNRIYQKRYRRTHKEIWYAYT